MSKMRIRNAVTGQVREIAVPAKKKPKTKITKATVSTPVGGDKGKGGKSDSGKASG